MNQQSPEFVTVDNVRYMKGRNGKLWRCPPVQYHNRDLYEGMSAMFYGWPELNEAESQAYDAVLPFLAQMAESAEEQFDDLAAGECSYFAHGGPAMDLSPEAIAYRMAEELVALGWTPPLNREPQ